MYLTPKASWMADQMLTFLRRHFLEPVLCKFLSDALQFFIEEHLDLTVQCIEWNVHVLQFLIFLNRERNHFHSIMSLVVEEVVVHVDSTPPVELGALFAAE
jgi:hypothetical protein